MKTIYKKPLLAFFAACSLCTILYSMEKPLSKTPQGTALETKKPVNPRKSKIEKDKSDNWFDIQLLPQQIEVLEGRVNELSHQIAQLKEETKSNANQIKQQIAHMKQAQQETEKKYNSLLAALKNMQ